MKSHPSGRPITKDKKRSWGWWSFGDEGYRLPRLNRPRHNTEAIGFLDPRREDGPDDYEAKRKR